MNLPNKLTMMRVVLVPVFMIFAAVSHYGTADFHAAYMLIAGVIFAIASITDFLDGYLARKNHLVTDFGKFMDPLADKFLVISACLGIIVKFDYIRPVFVWASAIVIFREFAVTSLRMVAANKAGLVIAAAWLGKVKTTTQMICIICVLLEPVILPFKPFTEWHILSYVTTAVMVVMTLWSGIDYLIAYKPYIGETK